MSNNTIKCPECGSNDLKWHFRSVNSGSAQNGRIRLSEVSGEFFLGCEECSETINSKSADEVAADMTNQIHVIKTCSLKFDHKNGNEEYKCGAENTSPGDGDFSYCPYCGGELVEKDYS